MQTTVTPVAAADGAEVNGAASPAQQALVPVNPRQARYQHEQWKVQFQAQQEEQRRKEDEQRRATQEQRRAAHRAEKQRQRQERCDQLQKVGSRIAAWWGDKQRSRQMARGGLRHSVHRFGHRYLKLLFVTALAASTSLFFIGRVIPNPPGIVIVVIGSILGGAIELSYYTVSCDLTDAITDGHKGSTVLNGFYTLIGAAASWFFFTNAALHVGWAPADDLIGLSRTAWAMIAGALVVGIVFVLSARRERPESATDLQAMARFVMVSTPDYSEEERLLALAGMANALRAARQSQTLAAPEPAVEALPVSRLSSNQEGVERISAESRPGAKYMNRMERQGEEGNPELASNDLPIPAERDNQRLAYSEIEAATPSLAPRFIETTDLLPRTIVALTYNPDIPDEALAAVLGLKKPASAHYWRLKAMEVLTGHQTTPTSARSNEEQRPRTRRETLTDLIRVAEELQDETGLDLMALVRQGLDKSAASAQVSGAPLARPVEETGKEPVKEYSVPIPGVREPGTNHHQQDAAGLYERMGSVEGEGGDDDDTSFRQSTN